MSETKIEQILEGNKLIAEFMGLKPRFVEYPNHQLNRWEVEDKFRYSQPIKYHESWDWLMTAWFKFQQKLNEMSSEDGRYKSYLSHTQTTFCIGICEDENILSCHQTLIEGIKWYNKSFSKISKS